MYLKIVLIIFVGIVTIAQATSPNKTIAGKFLHLNGVDTQPGEFPHIVSLQIKNYPIHLCSGSIIHPQWVLISASCVVENLPDYIICAGKHNIYEREPHEQHVMVETVHLHERYVYEGFAYDIALLKLEKELKMNDKVHPIALPVPDSQPEPTKSLILAGWGRYQDYKARDTLPPSWPSNANILQKVTVLPIALEECRKVDIWDYKNINENNLCTSGRSACWGDRGNPLINQQRELVGMLVHGASCCCEKDDPPDIHIRVSAFIGWIKSHVPPLPPISAGSSFKIHLSQSFISLLICRLFGILQFNYSL